MNELSNTNIEVILNENQNLKPRHWLVSAYLIYGMGLNGFEVFWNIYKESAPYGRAWLLDPDTSMDMTFPVICSILSGFKVLFYSMIWNWKKIGFSGFCIISFIFFIVRIILRNSIFDAVLVTGFEIGILYYILKFKKNGVEPWSMLR